MTMVTPARQPWRRWAPWIVCLLVFIVIVADVIRAPLKHTTMPTYRFASNQWWAGLDPYTANQHAGFLYFPQAAILFTPFNLLPFLVGEIAWRAAVFGLFIYALMRLHGVFLARGNADEKSLLFLCLLAVPSAFASLRNAQFDLPLAALLVLTVVEVASAQWTSATVWLCLALALKPLGVVPLLLFGAWFGPLRPRLLIGLLIVLLIPFLHWNPAFVMHEYLRCFQTMTAASVGDEPRYSDLAALLAKAGLVIPLPARTILRLLAALIYFGLSGLAVRRLPRIDASWLMGALSADYLMLFNPRTETCSYVFLGPFVASLAIFISRDPSRKQLGHALGLAALGLACDAFPRLGALSVHDATDRWLKPLVALLFLPVLISLILKVRAMPDVRRET